MPKFLTIHFVLGIFAGALGGFQHGYHTAHINNPGTIIKDWMRDILKDRTGDTPSDKTVTLLFSMGGFGTYCLGGMIGGLITAPIVKKLGKKLSLIWHNIITMGITSALFCFCVLAKSFEMFIIARLFAGINNGLNSGICPMFLLEISPISIRGGIGTIYQLMVVISILFAQILSLREILGTEQLWSWMLCGVVSAVLCLIQIIFTIFTKDTPPAVLDKGDEEKAKKVLIWYRKTDDVNEEFAIIKHEHEKIITAEKVEFKDVFTKKALRTPLIIAIVIMLSQQLSGINAVIFYSTAIFKQAGISEQYATYCTVGIGFVNIIATIVAIFLVERFGRKSILLWSFGGMIVATSLIFVGMLLEKVASAFLYIALVNIFTYIIFFAVGAGPIPWFLVSELFKQNARPIAGSIACGVNWFANTIVSIAFPSLMEIMSAYVFIIFVVLQVLFFLFILFKVPETKNKPIEEITALYE